MYWLARIDPPVAVEVETPSRMKTLFDMISTPVPKQTPVNSHIQEDVNEAKLFPTIFSQWY